MRLRHLTHALEHTDLSLSAIAVQMRFSSAHELSRFFFSETGQRPGEYRDRNSLRGPQRTFDKPA